MKTNFVLDTNFVVKTKHERTLYITVEQDQNDIFLVLTDGFEKRRLVGVRDCSGILNCVRWSNAKTFNDVVNLTESNRPNDLFTD